VEKYQDTVLPFAGIAIEWIQSNPVMEDGTP